ncbi:MAG TPA: S53 family peptidase [Marmoricola sp.]
MSRNIRTTCAVVASAALAAGTLGLSPAADAASHSHQLAGSVPSWAKASHRVGTTQASTPVTFRVYQAWRGGNAARQFAMSVSTPGSANYRHFLSPQQFRARFAPSKASTRQLEKWLRGQGFKVTGVPSNRKYVQVSGTLGQAAKTFSTGFARYRVDGKTLRSNTAPLTVPASMTGKIQAVVGLDQSQALVHADKAPPPPPLFRNAGPCSTYWGEKTVADAPATLPAHPQNMAPCGYAGAQLQGAYGMDSVIKGGTDGSGVTVGIIDAYASPSIESDANRYFEHVGLPTFKSGQFRQDVAPGTYNRAGNKKQDPAGWAGEETLDVEAVHTMAPGANIVYIGAPNNYRDMDAIMNRVVNNHLADIVTNSYGYGGEALPSGYIKPSLDTQAQAAAEGMSLLYSSGDNGDETGGNPANAKYATPDWPASSPLVTAVGGTSLGVGQANNRVFEFGWETGKQTLKDGAWSAPFYQYGAGGGTSRLFTQPSYQAGVVGDDMSMGTESGGRSQAMRVVPDVAALGDPTTGMLVGETQTAPDGSVVYDYYRIGGTSLASPLYAGMLALAEQQAGHEFGLANPALYQSRAASIDIKQPATRDQDETTDPTGAVRPDFVNGVDATDGISYTSRLFDYDQPLTIHVRDGYDDVTGIGVPDGQAWITALVAASAAQ